MVWTQGISLLAGFHEKENSLETSIVMVENFSPKGFFWLNMKNFEISVLTANSRYLQAATLKIIWQFFSKHLQNYLKYSPCWSKFPSATKHNLVSVHLKFWAFSHDVMAAMLMFQNNETEAMLVYKGNPLGVEFISYVNTFFCSNKLADAGLVSENALYRPLLFVVIVVFSSTYAKEEIIAINPTGNLLAGYHQLGACTQSDQPLYRIINEKRW